MGLLDDAIREHLDLKRQHGADEDELARQEAEALGPVTDEDMSVSNGTGAGESDGEREPGWPFDRVAENELAGEPDEPSFEWSSEDSEPEVEVPDFVPAEPPPDPALEEEPEPVDQPTQAFTAVDSLEAEEKDEERAGALAGDLEAGSRADDSPESPADPETRLLTPDAESDDARLEADETEPELAAPEAADPEILESEAEPIAPEAPSNADPGLIEEDPAHEEPPPLEHSASVVDEPVEPVNHELDPDEGVFAESTPLPAETEEPPSEPDPLEPDLLGSVEPEPSAESGEPPEELEPPLAPPPGEERLAASADPLHGERPGGDPPTGPDPAAEQGSPPGEFPQIEEDLGPVTQAWSIESDPGFGAPSPDEAPGFDAPQLEDLGPPPIEERPVFEPLPYAEDGPDDPLEPPSDAPLELGAADADLDPPPGGLDDAHAEPPAAARGFFEEAEEDDTLWREERPAFDPDFEN